MKNFLTFIIALIFPFLAACSENDRNGKNGKENDTLSATPLQLEFAADDTQTKTVTVETNAVNWNLSQSVDWIVIKKESGYFTVGVEKNRVTDNRIGTVTVKAGEAEPVTVAVTQLAGEEEKAVLTVTPTELEFTALGQETQSVSVSTNVSEWNTSQSASWLFAEKSGNKLSVTVERNFAVAVRTGTVTVTAGNADPVVVTVTQFAGTSGDWALDTDLQVLKAFPGAEGFGAETTGGRGGRVLYVTNLDDADKNPPQGSFRWAVEQSGARTVMFKVSGRIKLKSRLSIRNGDLTIAGHSAPGDGICISDYSVVVSASNVIIRYMRFRMGDEQNFEDDALWGRYQKNVIIDHCSMSWSVDECSSFYNNENFTMQWCILSESLRISAHDKGAHGYGGIWGGKGASFHHNLLAHHDSRNPRFAAYDPSSTGGAVRLEGLTDFRNNVIYNWGGNSGYGGEGGNYNMVNNYYKPTPGSGNSARICAPDPDRTAGGLGLYGVFYVAGNYMLNPNGTPNTQVINDNWTAIQPNGGINKNDIRSSVEFPGGDVTTHTAQEAYGLVLAGAGANFRRDATDTRVVNEVRNGLAPVRAYFTLNPAERPAGVAATRAGLIDSQKDVGGWETYSSVPAPADTDGDGIPDEWEIANGLNPNSAADGAAKSLSGGTYTNLEVYLYDLLRNK